MKKNKHFAVSLLFGSCPSWISGKLGAHILTSSGRLSAV
jgi:hypothetical protein